MRWPTQLLIFSCHDNTKPIPEVLQPFGSSQPARLVASHKIFSYFCRFDKGADIRPGVFWLKISDPRALKLIRSCRHIYWRVNLAGLQKVLVLESH